MKMKRMALLMLVMLLLLGVGGAYAEETAEATINLVFDGKTYTDTVQVEWTKKYPVPEGGVKWDGSEEFNYIPPIEDGNIITITQNGHVTTYLKNQLMLLTKSGESVGYYFDTIEQLAAKYNARVVGYIAMQETYQIEFVEDLSYDELNLLIGELEKNDAVLPNTVSLCYVYEIADNNIANYWGGSGKPSTTEISGNNWGVEFIGVPSLWNYSDYMDVVEVVVHDSGFGKNDDVVVHEIYKNTVDESTSPAFSGDHSLHVAGIIGASHNGEIGIDGVFPKARIYGYSHRNKTSLTLLQSCLQDLINADIRVFNFSWGFELQTQLDAFNDANEAFERQKQGWNLGQALFKLIDRDKDFVLVCSAGNGGYLVDPLYNGFFQIIPRAIVNNHDLNEVVDRIIVVGAISQNGYAEFSQSGNRVDILAPGVNILSTISDNRLELLDGTSMSAPHVTGVAALIWSMNQNLRGSEVKDYILSTSKTLQPLSDDPNRSKPYPVLDAKKSVELMLGELGKGFFACCITGEENSIFRNAVVTLAPKDSNQGNVITQNTDETGLLYMIVPSGQYELQIRLEGYWPFAQDITIPRGTETKLNVLLKPDKSPETTMGTLNGMVTINSEGLNSVEVNVLKGTTPVITLIADNGYFDVDLEPGTYTLSIDADGYVPTSRDITVFTGKTTTENIELDDSMYAVATQTMNTSIQYDVKLFNAHDSITQLDMKVTLKNGTVLMDTANGIRSGVTMRADGFAFQIDDELAQGAQLEVTAADGQRRTYSGAIVLSSGLWSGTKKLPDSRSNGGYWDANGFYHESKY